MEGKREDEGEKGEGRGREEREKRVSEKHIVTHVNFSNKLSEKEHLK